MKHGEIQELATKIKAGGIGVMPTDTIFGIVGSALDQKVVERIYQIKGREFKKPFVIIISDIEDLRQFSVGVSDNQASSIKNLWPGEISVILPCPSNERLYLHRGLKSLAVRIPALDWFRDLVRLTGPIVATSANVSGEPTPPSIDEIRQQIPGLDFYIDGPTTGQASRLVKVHDNGTLEWLSRN